MAALLLLVPTAMVVELCARLDIVEDLGSCLDTRCFPSAVSCNVCINFPLVLPKCKPVRLSRRQLLAVILSRSERLSCSSAARLSRLILLATFASPASEAVIVITCVVEMDALKEFIVFNGRDVTS
ncbi:hypothetical protein DFH29DRAFT_389525 [Suillus ampliporus]|nr:hypothetical protein DFH29DRAFT_389525 [Suillus ampliporus]